VAGALSARSWGRLPLAAAATTVAADWRFQALPGRDEVTTLLAHGARRSYGDSCINSGGTELDTRQLDRFIALDSNAGTLRCDAGVTLQEILRLVVPRGWFLPVLPGTQFVTVGGAIANDIHGKNHHVSGSFGCHVDALTLLRSDGERRVCSESDNAGLFAATIGGLGLTGLITEATLRLRPIACDRLVVENLVFNSAQEFSQLSGESMDWEYTVSWVDVFARAGRAGRGIFSRARHVDEPGELTAGGGRMRMSLPFAPPLPLVNSTTVDLFNRAYFLRGSRGLGVREQHFQPFFFPLDAIAHWNRLYGRQGFYQYQCVIPRDGGVAILESLLRRIADSREASFLAVLKEFGERRSPGLLSFPRPGFTLALDFPNRGAKTLTLFQSLDDIVMSAGGALYPAKDARMSAQTFARSFPGSEVFSQYVDPRFCSNFWRRVRTGL